MTDIVGLAIGVFLGLWSTHRLERDAASLVHQRSLNLPWLFGHWAVRGTPILAAVWMMLAWSSSAPLAGLGGFWLGRTVYLAAALLKSRRFA